MASEPTAYRPCAGVMLVNHDGLIFVGARIDNPGDAWQMPQGGIDKGEDPLAAAFREMEEEIGTAKAELVAESSTWLTYDLPPELMGKMWKGKYRGQKQKWFLMRFTGSDADINIETKHPEFRAWKWAQVRALPDLIVPFKRDLYAALVSEFEPQIAAIRR